MKSYLRDNYVNVSAPEVARASTEQQSTKYLNIPHPGHKLSCQSRAERPFRHICFTAKQASHGTSAILPSVGSTPDDTSSQTPPLRSVGTALITAYFSQVTLPSTTHNYSGYRTVVID